MTWGDVEQSSVVTDGNWHRFVTGRRKTGYVERDWAQDPCGGTGYAAPFSMPLIPEDEWIDRIRERKANRSRLVDLMEMAKLKPYHQSSTPLCWANGTTFMAQIKQIIFDEQKKVLLSSGSVAALATGYRLRGGWGMEAIKVLHDFGAARQAIWPANSVDRRYDTKSSRDDRLNNQADQWWDLQPRNFGQLVTCLLSGLPVSVAYNWQRHLVCAIDAVEMQDGSVGILTANSGLARDRNGFTIYSGRHAVPDEAISLMAITAA
ncbi:hypothetical protein KOR42_22890 [Thalassoglobus neptunius]|uniref:Uncharacterized protein n=1 Tax=Thalassoglobus neptunius TaxID=1938619 RepID=A0A5C5XAL1_9PLAN|nr:hypothetical protein [Thalassoglobus neptunius]TWT58902.1 hypothetical protein KOR42_22890 [Thalassoglobus neptunius]